MKRDLLKRATSFSKAGFRIFRCTGKVPSGLWRNKPYIEPADVEELLGDWNGNYGIALNKRQLVIDIDPRNFKQGDSPHRRLFKACGISPKGFSTTIQTGGGGIHMFLTLPPLEPGFKIKKTHKDYQGIDFISDGGYVIGAGSLHPETNNFYEMVDHYPHPDEMVMAPQALIDLITTEKAQTTDLKGIGEAKVDDQQAIIRFSDFLSRANPAVEGAGGDAQTFAVACKGRDFGLTAQKVLDLMWETWNPRCSPEWSMEQLTVKVKNAYDYAENELGSDHPEADFKPVHGKVVERHQAWRGWDRDEKGQLKKTLNNVVCFFINHHETPDNPLLDSIVFDEFSQETMKTKWLPWDRPEGKRFPKIGIEWADKDSIALRHFLSSTKRLNVSITDVEHAVTTASHFVKRHPVKEYLNDLKWDGTARLETWLINSSGAADTRVNKALSKLMIMQAVARIYNPGCQADIIVILEGGQGIGKSQLVRALGGEFYADIFVDPNNKDTPEGMRGRWILEMSEMRVLRKSDADSLKSFITKTTDRYRPAYARRTINVARQSVFIGTFNKDSTGEYLTDNTGNRRFGPIDLGESFVNVEKIKKWRDQVFAEATYMLLQGTPWHITDERINNELKAEQKKRLSSDVFSSPVADYINKNKPYKITTESLWVKALSGDVKNCNKAHQRRIAGVLRELGYTSTVQRIDGVSRRCYKNEKFRRNEPVEGLFDD